MKIQSAEFVKSSPSIGELPEGGLPEFAFIGRSNVGKSSLLNFLVSHKNLARTSSKPGRTKLINHFLINNSFYFVDLPGYGFAKSSKTDRLRWGQNSEQYLLNRQSLVCLFVLLDINVEPQQTDLEFLVWLNTKEINVAVVLTKTDKPNQSTMHKHSKLYEAELNKVLAENTSIFRVSVVKKKGKDEILKFVEKKFVSNCNSN